MVFYVFVFFNSVFGESQRDGGGVGFVHVSDTIPPLEAIFEDVENEYAD